MIKSLETTNVGPAPMALAFGERLNLLTGDNGLGKSFLLDIVWWTLTRVWPLQLNRELTSGEMAIPTDKKATAKITYSLDVKTTTKQRVATFSMDEQRWRVDPGQGQPGHAGLVFYAMADGGFAVWDPARNYWSAQPEAGEERPPPAYVFSPKEVWNGLEGQNGRWHCNGLIRDWASWQKEKGAPFASLKAALRALSPPGEALVPGALTRVRVDDARDIPTVKTPYGQEVAVTLASAGIRRVIALAYFLVWCWEEHIKAMALRGRQPEQRAVFLIDEVEAHLHPKWQRTVVSTLLGVMNNMATVAKAQAEAEIKAQLIIATHSPLVMASLETQFDAKRDAWFDLDFNGAAPELTRRDYTKRGDAVNWLTSEAFDMPSGYAIGAENAMSEAALALADESFDKNKARALDKRLREVLSDTDPFWMRWRFVGEKKGWLE